MSRATDGFSATTATSPPPAFFSPTGRRCTPAAPPAQGRPEDTGKGRSALRDPEGGKLQLDRVERLGPDGLFSLRRQDDRPASLMKAEDLDRLEDGIDEPGVGDPLAQINAELSALAPAKYASPRPVSLARSGTAAPLAHISSWKRIASRTSWRNFASTSSPRTSSSRLLSSVRIW